MLVEEVGPEEIAGVVSKWTGEGTRRYAITLMKACQNMLLGYETALFCKFLFRPSDVVRHAILITAACLSTLLQAFPCPSCSRPTARS